MDDPDRQMQKLGASQGSEQDQNEAARAEWLKRVPGFVAYAQKIIAPLKETHGVQAGAVSRRIHRFQDSILKKVPKRPSNSATMASFEAIVRQSIPMGFV